MLSNKFKVKKFTTNPKGFTLVRSEGFTLVELLIVITIIAILSAIALVSYSSFTKNARDTKRKTDLNFVQAALEQYFADQHYYPEAGSGECPDNEDGQLRFGCSLTSPDGSKGYLSTVPQESITTNSPYSYVPSPTGCDNSTTLCNSYCLFAQMENSSNGKEDTECPLLGNYNYSVTRP